jgi:hypothetical protein
LTPSARTTGKEGFRRSGRKKWNRRWNRSRLSVCSKRNGGEGGTALFQRICELDLEGIVAKQKFGPYVAEREHSTWFKILSREYSQKDGRKELFERERHQEPIAGWHCCTLACEVELLNG